MGRLTDHIAYLMGPMDEAKDRGHGWRVDMKKFLNDLGIGAFCPFKNPVIGAFSEDDEYFNKINRLKQQGKYDEAVQMTKKVCTTDLHLVDLANFGILYVDKNLHMCGSYGEQTYMCLEKKPLIINCPTGKSTIPNWLLGMGIRHEMIFRSWVQVKNYIKYIHTSDEIDDLGKWRFINYDKVFSYENQG